MPLRVWTGTAYVDATPALFQSVPGGNTPKEAYIWDGTKYVKVWPEGVVHVQVWTSANAGVTSWPGFVGGVGFGGYITNSAPYRAGMAALGVFGGSANMVRVFGSAVATDDHEIEVDLTTTVNGTLDTSSTGQATTFRVRSASTFASGTAVEFTITGHRYLKIQSANGAAMTVQASKTLAANMTDQTWIFRAQGNVYSIIRKSTGAVELTWTDTGGLVAAGPGNRYATMTQTAYKAAFGTQYGSYSVARWVFRDI